METDLQKLRREDFTLTFEAAGTDFLFEDLVVNYYMWPVGESLSLDNKKSKRVFVPNTSIKRLQAEGNSRTTADTEQKIRKLDALFAEAMAEVAPLQAKEQLSLTEVKRAFNLFDRSFGEYLYFDAWYWDRVYESAKANPEARKNVELVEGYKNVARSKFEPLCFERGGYLPTLIEKLSNQFAIPPADLGWYRGEEVLSLFEGKKLSDKDLTDRHRAYAYYVDGKGAIHFFSGDEALRFIDGFDKDTSSSSVVFKGKGANIVGSPVKAKVRIIRRDYGDKAATQAQIDAMEQGEVLVSETTDPELMGAFHKACAVVTDIGGLLSHAAITARELNLPCIVGTGNASKVLKTGDLVEVDAEKGIVHILQRI